MSIRNSIPGALLVAGLCLAACDSSPSSPAGPDGTSDPSNEDEANGILALAGATLPVQVTGVYDDTMMLITIRSNVAGSPDTGWVISISAKPGKSALALPYDTRYITENQAARFMNGNLSACTYSLTAGSLHIDSWSETAYATGKLATMSGGAVMTLTPDSPSPLCSAVSGDMSFTNAAAGRFGP